MGKNYRVPTRPLPNPPSDGGATVATAIVDDVDSVFPPAAVAVIAVVIVAAAAPAAASRRVGVNVCSCCMILSLHSRF